MPRMFDTINNRVGYDTVGGLPLMSFTTVNPKGMQFAIKHAFDRLFASLLLVVLSPLLLCTALAVRLSSPGPTFFRQRRVGRDGQEFDLYKFRSMRLDPSRTGLGDEDPNALEFLLVATPLREAWRGMTAAPRSGAFCAARRSMSCPAVQRPARRDEPDRLRPERPEFVEMFISQDINRYDDRHRVKSGITGWAQVHGLRGQTSLAERVEWDNYYIVHWSLGLDAKIFVLTLLALFRNGAE